MKGSLSKALTDKVVRRLAGTQSYLRGVNYSLTGHVKSLKETDESIDAVVSGTLDYQVRLTAEDDVLDYSCNCPAGSEGGFCKHCVAVAVAWLTPKEKPSKVSGKKAKALSLADAGKILKDEDSATLVKLVLDWAKDDDQLRQRIILYAARRSGPDAGTAAVQRLLEKSISVRRYVDYREARSWARGVDKSIDAVEQLLNDGQAIGVIELCESALRSLLEAIQRVDDSDGHFQSLRDRLQDFHYRACVEARPEPSGLARRLFNLELHSDFEVFYGAAERYAEIFGAEGMKAYRELAEEEWAKVPVHTTRAEWNQHFRITNIMQSLARASGDIEELVGVMSRDLTSGYSYLRIAEVYREAREQDKALLWAEKGLIAFPQNIDGRLREFVAEQYHARHRHDDAMKLIWGDFMERAFLDGYRNLEKHAKEAGVWPEWRERALGEMRETMANAKAKARGRTQPLWWAAANDNSRLVEIFLYEGDPEAAWVEARAGGCSDNCWLRLAEISEKEHPEEAWPIYVQLAKTLVDTVNDGKYDNAVGLLIRAGSVMRRVNRGIEFLGHLEALRAKYRNKRNFIKLVELNRKALYGS